MYVCQVLSTNDEQQRHTYDYSLSSATSTFDTSRALRTLFLLGFCGYHHLCMSVVLLLLVVVCESPSFLFYLSVRSKKAEPLRAKRATVVMLFRHAGLLAYILDSATAADSIPGTVTLLGHCISNVHYYVVCVIIA